MSDESTQATAENLRADFLNATTTHARWGVLNRAIEWAVTASENADHYRQKAQSRVQTDEHRCSALADVNGNVVAEGDEVGWGDDEDGWIVRHVYRDGTVIIAPRDSSSAAEEWVVGAQDLWV